MTKASLLSTKERFIVTLKKKINHITTAFIISLAFFMGGGPELNQESLIYSSQDRLRLRTQASGTVILKLGIIMRNFEKYGVETC